VDLDALERNRKWSFVPRVETGSRLRAGAVLGAVQEGHLTHRIMVPFDEPGELEVTWIQEGSVTVETPVARIRGANGEERSLSLLRRWPVRRPLPERKAASPRPVGLSRRRGPSASCRCYSRRCGKRSCASSADCSARARAE